MRMSIAGEAATWSVRAMSFAKTAPIVMLGSVEPREGIGEDGKAGQQVAKVPGGITHDAEGNK